MNTKNKEFKYKGYNFNIKIELFSSVERRPNGKNWHTITISDMGTSNFYIKKEILDENLEKEIFELEHKAKLHVDNKSEIMKNCNHLLGSLCDENVYINDFSEKVYDISETQKNLSKYSFMKKNPDSPKQIVDGRKGYLFRFNFCPYCGEKLNWKEIISKIK